MNLKEFVEQKTILEASLSRINKFITEGRPFGIITAFRGDYNKKENLKRNKELESAVRSAGYGFSKMEGHYVENFGTADAKDVNEISLFVVGNENENGNLKGTLKKLGAKYDQDSIFYKPEKDEFAYLIGTNSTGWPGLGKVEKIGKWVPNKVGEFYSKMKGKKFVFESVILEGSSWLGKWAKKVCEEKED